MNRTTQKRLTILTVLFIIIGLLVVVKDRFGSFFTQKSNTVFLTTSEQIDTINLIRKTETITLFKKNNHWYTKHNNSVFNADSNRVQTLADSLSQLTKIDVVSTNIKKRHEFGIGDEKIEFRVNNKTHTLYIGKQTGSNTYVAADSSSDIFLSENFPSVFTPADYRDLSIHAVTDETKVTSVAQIYDAVTFKIDKKNNAWYLEGKPIKQERVDFLLNDLKTLQATDVRVAKPSEQADMTVEIVEQGKKRQMNIYQKTDKLYEVSIAGTEFVYEVPASYIQSLKKTDSDFNE